jgi:hypothetical protein
MRSLITAIGLAALVAGCAAPAPPTATATPSPVATLSATPATLAPTDAPTPLPTMPAFGDPYPDQGWAVVASWDASGDRVRVVSKGQAKARALIDVAYACDKATQLTIRATDQGTGDAVVGLGTQCLPGSLGRATFPSTGRKMTVNFDSASVDPAVRFWVKIAVPTDHYLP